MSRWWSLVLLLLVSASYAHAQAQPKIVTLGDDLTPEQRAELLTRFGATEGVDTILTINRDEQIAAMQNIIPVDAGYTAISSSALTCPAPGSGLQITTENIDLVTPAMYAGALLTAGITDAQLTVAAPAGAVSQGMTALTGIFRAFDNGACGRAAVDPLRQELATRWLATTAAIGNALGDNAAAARVMLSAQQQLIVGGQSDPAAVVPALDNAQTDTGVVVPPAQREAALELLRRMAEAKPDWGGYGTGWNLQDLAPNQVAVVPNGAAPPPVFRTISGTVRTAYTAATSLTIDVAGQQGQLNLPVGDVVVTRDNQPAQLTDLQPGDTVTMELGDGDVVRRVTAYSPEAVEAGASGNYVGRFVVGTVAGKEGDRLTVVSQRSSGPEQFTIPAGAAIRRDGVDATMDEIAVNDSVVVFLGLGDAVESVHARVDAGNYWIDGTVENMNAQGRLLRMQLGDRPVIIAIPEGDPPVTLNDRPVTLDDIRPGDAITVKFSPQGQVAELNATRAGGLANWSRYLWLLIPLLLLLLAALFFFGGGRRRQALLVLPSRRRRVVDADDIDELFDQRDS
jgi:uncharacterized protein YpuA (DUF1002 family)